MGENSDMTREHRKAKWRALCLSARLRDRERVVISHDRLCGVHRHLQCSCLPIIAAYTADGEAYVLDDDGRRLYRLERS